MKKRTVNLIIITASILLASAVAVILWTKPNSAVSFEAFKAKSEIRAFLNAVINEDYDKAVKYIAFYTGTNDNAAETTDEYTEAWKARISDLKSKNIFLESFTDLDVRTFDGVMKCKVSLSVNDVGVPLVLDTEIYLRVDENAGLFGIKYKIVDITDEEVRLEIEDALSGRMGD